MNDLQRQYLRAAHDLAIEDPMHTFNEDEIANHVDLDPKQLGYVERLISTAEYLKEMGFLAPFHKRFRDGPPCAEDHESGNRRGGKVH